MTHPTSKKIHAFLQSENQSLQTLFAKVRELDELHNKVMRYLAPHLTDYCRVASLTANKLTIIVANASIATQLRLQTPDLLRVLKQDTTLKKIQDIQCKVRPFSTSSRLQPLVKPTAMQPLSTATAEIVRAIAESLQDPNLKRILLTIAGRTD